MVDPMSLPYSVPIKLAAELLGVTPVHLYRQCKDGKFPCVRIGRTVRIPKAEILRQLMIVPEHKPEIRYCPIP